MSKIAVTGSLHYDIMLDADRRPEKGETVMGTRCRYKFGGKGGNQAVALAMAGTDVIFAGAVGDDEQGKFLLDTLEKAGVNTQFITVAEGCASGMSVAITDAEGDYGAVVVSNANQRIALETFQQDAFWHDVDVLVLQNEVPEAVNLCAATEAKQRGVRVCLNAAPARQLSPTLEASIDVLVVNAIEARDMSDITVNCLHSAGQAAEKLSMRFPCVVVTAGEHGVAYGERGQAIRLLAAKKIQLVSTHGAGDCFTGVLCAGLSSNKSLSDAVFAANEAAARHVSAGKA